MVSPPVAVVFGWRGLPGSAGWAAFSVPPVGRGLEVHGLEVHGLEVHALRFMVYGLVVLGLAVYGFAALGSAVCGLAALGLAVLAAAGLRRAARGRVACPSAVPAGADSDRTWSVSMCSARARSARICSA